MTTPSLVGQYRIIKKIGAGGMGLVFLGEHTLLGRRAAIKTLLPTVASNREIVERFFTEARATSSIADPGVIQIFDFGYHVDGTAYIVMELLEGEALSARLERLGKLSLGDALRFARQIAGSLAAAHAQHIVHRDLKPENIFLVRDTEAQGGERTKIIDFGICKMGAGDPNLTEVGAMIGTPVYMSPEQCRGSSEVDRRSDIYAFGCLMFHLLTGRPPFVGEASGDLIVAHLQEPPPRPSQYVPELPEVVDALVLQCLAKAPEDRFASMTALQSALGDLASELETAEPIAAAPPPTVPMVPLGRGFRSMYDANLAAWLNGARAGSPVGLRFGERTPRTPSRSAPVASRARSRASVRRSLGAAGAGIGAGSPPGSQSPVLVTHPLRPGLQLLPPPPAESPGHDPDGVGELDERPRRNGLRAVLACVLVAGAALGLIATPLFRDGDDGRPAAHAGRAVPSAAAPIEGQPAAKAPEARRALDDSQKPSGTSPGPAEAAESHKPAPGSAASAAQQQSSGTAVAQTAQAQKLLGAAPSEAAQAGPLPELFRIGAAAGAPAVASPGAADGDGNETARGGSRAELSAAIHDPPHSSGPSRASREAPRAKVSSGSRANAGAESAPSSSGSAKSSPLTSPSSRPGEASSSGPVTSPADAPAAPARSFAPRTPSGSSAAGSPPAPAPASSSSADPRAGSRPAQESSARAPSSPPSPPSEDLYDTR